MRRMLEAIAALLLVLAAAPAAAVTYSTPKVLSGPYGDRPQMNARGEVVWETVGSIYLYDGNATTCLFHWSEGQATRPRINASGQVVWYAFGDQGMVAYLWDGSAVTQLTTGPEQAWIPDIDDLGNVYWLASYGWLMRRDPAGVVTPLSQGYVGQYFDVSPRGAVVANETTDYGDQEIWLYAGGTATRLTTNDRHDYYPHVNSAGQVAWHREGTAEETEIFFFDGATTVQVTDNATPDYWSELGESGSIVWRMFDGNDDEIGYWDGQTVRLLTDNAWGDGGAKINASDWIVWSGFDGNDSEIFLFDGAATTQLTSNDVADDAPEINDRGDLVWIQDRRIVLASPSAPNSAPHPAPAGGGVAQLGSPVVLAGSVADLDGDLVSYAWLEGTEVLAAGAVQTVAGGAPVELPPFTLAPPALGSHVLALQVDDGVNPPQTAAVVVEVVDTTAPALSLLPDRTILWPPNHELVDVVVRTRVADASGTAIAVTASVTSDEPAEGLGDGDVAPDVTAPRVDAATGAVTVRLRAERAGAGTGRAYTIHVIATDPSGNASAGDVVVRVPHDRR